MVKSGADTSVCNSQSNAEDAIIVICDSTPASFKCLARSVEILVLSNLKLLFPSRCGIRVSEPGTRGLLYFVLSWLSGFGLVQDKLVSLVCLQFCNIKKLMEFQAFYHVLIREIYLFFDAS
jgi:hypothetical protein